MLTHISGCVGVSAGVFICYTLLMVVRTEPWWQAQYFIPILGMLLGNAISGISVGLTTLLEEFASGTIHNTVPYQLRQQYLQFRTTAGSLLSSTPLHPTEAAPAWAPPCAHSLS